MTCGVPQGSTLGPLLCLLYVNDIAGAIQETSLLYADDTAVLISDSHVDLIVSKLENSLETISVWL